MQPIRLLFPIWFAMFENSVKIKPIVYRFPRMIWSVNQIELFGFFTDLGILTSPRIFRFYSPRVQKRIVDSPTWSAEQNISQAGKSVFHKIPGHVLEKILETFIRSFPSSFSRKYVHTVVFLGTARFVCNAYSGCNSTCPFSSTTVALTDFYRCL